MPDHPHTCRAEAPVAQDDASLPLYAADRDYLREHLKVVPPFRALVRAVESLFYRQAGAIETPALDLGCGDGYFAGVTFDRPFAAGIDPDVQSIEDARKLGRHVSLIRGDANNIPFSDGMFASVVSNCVLEHIPDLDGALREVHRVLQRGGRFLFSVPSHLFGEMLLGSTILRSCHLQSAARIYESYFNRISRHYHTDDPETWSKRLDAHAFKVIYHSYYLNAKAHRIFDATHYLSIHCLLSRKLTGRWTALTPDCLNHLYEHWLRPCYQARHGEPGPYLFFIAEKT